LNKNFKQKTDKNIIRRCIEKAVIKIIRRLPKWVERFFALYFIEKGIHVILTSVIIKPSVVIDVQCLEIEKLIEIIAPLLL
jgi:hypothetical protein